MQGFFDDRERVAVFLPGAVGMVVCAAAWFQYRRLKKEESHWRSWVKILLAFGFVFSFFCLDRLIAMRRSPQSWSAFIPTNLDHENALTEPVLPDRDSTVGPLALLCLHPMSSLLLILLTLGVLFLARFISWGPPPGAAAAAEKPEEVDDGWPKPMPSPSPPHTRPNLLSWLVPALPWWRREDGDGQTRRRVAAGSDARRNRGDTRLFSGGDGYFGSHHQRRHKLVGPTAADGHEKSRGEIHKKNHSQLRVHTHVTSACLTFSDKLPLSKIFKKIPRSVFDLGNRFSKEAAPKKTLFFLGLKNRRFFKSIFLNSQFMCTRNYK